MTTTGNRPDRGAFIPACLDDYPLTPNEFRVYAHIMRRAGTRKGNTHHESIPNTAKHCQMNVKTARNAIKVLRALRLVVVHERVGESSEIEPTHEDDWAPQDQVEDIRRRALNTPTKSGRGTKKGTTKSGTPPLPNQGGDPYQNEPRVPLPNQVPKGTPFKVPPEGTPSKVGESEVVEAQNVCDLILEKLLPLTEDYIPPIYRHDWHLTGLLPWRDRLRQVREDFGLFVGKQISFKGEQETQHPLRKGVAHVEKLEETTSGVRKLIGYWRDFEAIAAEQEPRREIRALPLEFDREKSMRAARGLL